MQIENIANQVLDAFERGEINATRSSFSDDFSFTGPMPLPLNKAQFLDLMNQILRGVPDWNFHRHDVRVEGQTVIVPVEITGTQSGTLQQLMVGMPILPPSNHSFHLPQEVMQIRFDGERIANIHVDPVHGGGIPGMLHQLGVSVGFEGHPDQRTQ